jgi:hypothetical protein
LPRTTINLGGGGGVGGGAEPKPKAKADAAGAAPKEGAGAAAVDCALQPNLYGAPKLVVDCAAGVASKPNSDNLCLLVV